MDPFLWRWNLDHPEHIHSSFPTLLLTESLMKDKHLRDLISDGKDRGKGRHRFLEDHGDPFASNGSHLLHGEIREVNTIKEDFSVDNFTGRLWYEPHDGQGSDGFSATRLTDQPKGFPLVQVKGHIVHCLGYALKCVEVCFEPLDIKKMWMMIHDRSWNDSNDAL